MAKETVFIVEDDTDILDLLSHHVCLISNKHAKLREDVVYLK